MSNVHFAAKTNFINSNVETFPKQKAIHYFLLQLNFPVDDHMEIIGEHLVWKLAKFNKGIKCVA